MKLKKKGKDTTAFATMYGESVPLLCANPATHGPEFHLAFPKHKTVHIEALCHRGA